MNKRENERKKEDEEKQHLPLSAQEPKDKENGKDQTETSEEKSRGADTKTSPRDNKDRSRPNLRDRERPPRRDGDRAPERSFGRGSLRSDRFPKDTDKSAPRRSDSGFDNRDRDPGYRGSDRRRDDRSQPQRDDRQPIRKDLPKKEGESVEVRSNNMFTALPDEE